jgi:hypothetical protein
MAALAVVTGCALTPQESSMDQTKITATSDATRTTAFTAADQAVDLARTLNPDLQLKLDDYSRLDDHWYDCSDDPRADTDAPKVIQWIADRTLYVEPHRETATLVDPIVKALVADGWTLGHTTDGDDAKTVALTRDGFTLTVGGQAQGLPDSVSPVGVGVSSPCITAPAGILDWKPAASPTPTSTSPSTPTP